jgi:hypothetical protein
MITMMWWRQEKKDRLNKKAAKYLPYQEGVCMLAVITEWGTV